MFWYDIWHRANAFLQILFIENVLLYMISDFKCELSKFPVAFITAVIKKLIFKLYGLLIFNLCLSLLVRKFFPLFKEINKSFALTEILKIILLRYNSDSIQFIHLKYTIQCFIVYSEFCNHHLYQDLRYNLHYNVTCTICIITTGNRRN